MYNLLTTADKLRKVSVGEAALYAAMGFLVVFFGIALLILIVYLIGKVMNGTSKKVLVPQAALNKETPSATTPENDLDEETVAVIMAALTAYYQIANNKCEFTVKRIKRI